jgi:hypothetical protein
MASIELLCLKGGRPNLLNKYRTNGIDLRMCRTVVSPPPLRHEQGIALKTRSKQGNGKCKVVSFMPRPLYLRGKSPRYRLGGTQGQSRCDEKKSLPLPGIEHQSSSQYPCHYTDCTIPAPVCYMYVYYSRGRSDYVLNTLLFYIQSTCNSYVHWPYIHNL